MTLQEHRAQRETEHKQKVLEAAFLQGALHQLDLLIAEAAKETSDGTEKEAE